MKAVTNGPKQVAERLISMKNLSIHCTAKKPNSDFVRNKWAFIGHQLCATIKNLNWQKQTVRPHQTNQPTTIELVVCIDLIALCLPQTARTVRISLKENEG